MQALIGLHSVHVVHPLAERKSAGDAVSSQLAGLLPNLVDKLTPNGRIETGGLDPLTKLIQGIR
jgi:uncharacterized protein YidB (DUF937 family)